ncbi:hypothetical protein [Fibrobacter succinogenes]|uniref:Arylamine N-acetyltransferase n=1 Tax=Fibrobacter succinogenes TaxID=833 RepID=A0A380S954_FIBSU|nr:hypothetical protein [Fibrobacter succinogenes]PWJ34049.1 hypothetical protein IE02_2633 [Fibrobacter succinogenes subsp. elongatus]SUQ25838.1 hypothetical protein SAMN05661053_2633 [Fibrobacter succinogenes]
MTPENMKKVVDLCNQISNITYENLTKIIRLEQTGSATGARKLDDSDQNDIDSWMGGGTCFSMTWHLYQTLTDMGFKPRLVMGHKRKERNIHCALILPDPDSNVTLEAHSADRAHNGSYRSLHSLQDDKSNLFSRSVSPASVPGSVLSSNSYLLDPGYLIFDPLQMPLPQPFGTGEAFFPLSPNCVRLVRPTLESMELWTGGAGAPMKLRFEYPVEGVSVEEFKHHWNESFYREMMTYPVLNRLDREKGIQYYYQKGNLVVRSSTGSKMTKIEPADRVQTLSDIFKLSPAIIEQALQILEKKH